ncbi:MAG: 16S rRNA (adenine(1518)-N(6)/adenine(1519)-N(6))-dimethyltransferase RsmA [Xanthomonadales bacterium]|jgi:16S rRNA (adenine1518-N6/adenine1519-N6)-dimethyltransferase|nr:16S rRNA (adenine(1518)-N(6)/adenine(1519)-N(6))-dimethyltransferase RsmA [Xanthomonadales bacterium]
MSGFPRGPEGHRARKRFGQNFLVDPQAIDSIIAALDLGADDAVVEIGPGRGALSFPLAVRPAALTLVEIDRDLAEWLRVEGLRRGLRYTVVEADALQVDVAALAAGRRLKLVGNLPYNISTPLLFHLLDASVAIDRIVVMLQKEVVERMAAVPGGRSWGRLSVMLQARCRVEPLFEVPPQSFRPVPAVDSAVVRLWPRADTPTGSRWARLSRVTRVAFSARRKQLGNTLKPLFDATALEALGIDRTRRPETLTVAEFLALADQLPESAGELALPGPAE